MTTKSFVKKITGQQYGRFMRGYSRGVGGISHTERMHRLGSIARYLKGTDPADS